MANTSLKTPPEIGDAIKIYFLSNGISQADAARMLNTTQPNVSSKLSGNRPFTMSTAVKWNKAFGFSIPFLMTGTGSLIDEKPGSISQSVGDNNTGVYMNAGNGATTSTPGNAGSERYFAKMCSELMQKILELNDRICHLEDENKHLKNDRTL